MDKQTTGAIILVIIATIVIGLLITFTNRNKETKTTELDTSLFFVQTVSEANTLIEKDSYTKPVFIYIGRSDCSACKAFEPYIQYSIGEANYYINYIELNDIDHSSEDFKKLLEVLHKYNYEYENETKPFDEYIGYTPMIFIVDKGEVVYGHIGSMSSDDIVKIVKRYGVNYE